MNKKKLIEKLDQLTIWAVPAGYVGGPAGTNKVVPVVKYDDVAEILEEVEKS